MQKNAIVSQFFQEKDTSTATLKNPINWYFIAFVLGLLSSKFNA
jgi:hypothetical protein